MDCNCGYDNCTKETIVNLSSSFPDNLSQTEIAKTRPKKCWWCGEKVYYYTNGFRDAVLFDSLRCPWEIHKCWVEYRTEKTTQLRNLSPKELDQQKRLILTGIIRHINKANFGFHGVTEEDLAYQMQITMEQLREGYGHVYTVDLGLIRVEYTSEKLAI
jgi:hypothetical protein